MIPRDRSSSWLSCFANCAIPCLMERIICVFKNECIYGLNPLHLIEPHLLILASSILYIIRLIPSYPILSYPTTHPILSYHSSYHILSYSILPLILSYPTTHPILSYHLSYHTTHPILSYHLSYHTTYPILSYPTTHPILFYPILLSSATISTQLLSLFYSQRLVQGG